MNSADQVINEELARVNAMLLPHVMAMGTEMPEAMKALYTPELEFRIPKREAIIVDMDGTLALLNGRGPFEQHKVDTDTLNEPVFEVVHSLVCQGYDVLITSGRFEYAREKTETWLSMYGVPYDRLLMRANRDYRKDAVVKREIYEEKIKPYYDVLLVLDDRQQVVDMWRELGLTCFQVAPGNF